MGTRGYIFVLGRMVGILRTWGAAVLRPYEEWSQELAGKAEPQTQDAGIKPALRGPRHRQECLCHREVAGMGRGGYYAEIADCLEARCGG